LELRVAAAGWENKHVLRARGEQRATGRAVSGVPVTVVFEILSPGNTIAEMDDKAELSRKARHRQASPEELAELERLEQPSPSSP